MRLIVLNHTSNGRNSRLASGKSIEGIDGFIRRRAIGQMHQYLYIGRCIIIYFFYFDIALIIGFQYRVDEGFSGSGKRYFGDNEGTFV